MLIDFQSDSFGKERTESGAITAFQEVPVHITIGGVDLLGYVEESKDESLSYRWGSLSILDLAPWGLYSIKRTREYGRYVYELGRHGDSGTALLFRMENRDILIYSTMTEKTVRISYRKLVEGWEAFAERVRNCILYKFPEMKDLAGWRE